MNFDENVLQDLVEDKLGSATVNSRPFESVEPKAVDQRGSALQACEINDEAIANVAAHHSLVSLVDL